MILSDYVVDNTLCCSEDPDVKGTETECYKEQQRAKGGCSEDPDVKGTETGIYDRQPGCFVGCSEDPDVKGTETRCLSLTGLNIARLQRGSRCKGN